jgi:Trk K+ transport system NAD-binding subunit
MKVIIVGGGRMGKQLAMDLPNSIIIENDPQKIDNLISIFGEERVLEGSGTSEEVLKEAGIVDSDALLVATNSDHNNYLVSIIAQRYKVSKIIVRVDEPDNIESFKQIGISTVICPAITAARMINSSLYPDTREITEICIFDESPYKGKPVSMMDLPDNSMVMAVLRGQHLIKAHDDLVLEKGDHVIICSIGGLTREVSEIVDGGEENLRPFNSVLTIIRREEDLDSVIREGICFAINFDIRLTIASTSDKLLETSVSKAAERGVDVGFKKLNTSKMGELTWVLQNELPEVQCVVIKVSGDGKSRRTESRELLSFIKSSRIPVLISKGTCPYRRIITLMGYEEQCEWSACLALKVALIAGADLHVMNYRDPDDIEQEKMLHLKRMGKMYDIDVTEEVVEGNPTIEFISKLTQGDFDLTVMNWDARIIKRDVLKRMFFESPMSILVYTS